jgi:anti-sigma regulatory factor (Ser/Thr protein kinase)
MSNPGEPDVVTSPRFPAHLSAVPAPREERPDRDLWQRLDDQGIMTLPLASPDEMAGGYRHEAFLYSGMAEFQAAATSFIRRAVQAGDPVLVVVTGSKIDGLRRELGAETQGVRFADMAKVGGNPGRIIAALRDFVSGHAGAPQLWGIAEPVYPGRSPAELAECQLHEALLNVTFDASTPFRLLCPYDLAALAGDVIDKAHRTHRFVVHGEKRQASSIFRPVDLANPFARPLPARPADAAYMALQPDRLDRLRAFVAQHAWRAGLDQESGLAIVRAVNEVATNSLQCGADHGEFRAWSDDHSLVCEVSDHGHITSPLAGRVPPAPAAGPGTGLWLANQLCDLVQIYSYPGETAIRLHQNR